MLLVQCGCLKLKQMILMKISDKQHDNVLLLLTFCSLVQPFAGGPSTTVLTYYTHDTQVTACILSAWLARLQNPHDVII